MSTKVVSMTVTESNSGMSSDPKLACNVNVMKTKNGILKFFEIILSLVLIVVFFKDIALEKELAYVLLAFLLCILSTLLATFLLLISYLISPMAAATLPKLFFELLHNVYSFLYYTCVSLALLIIFSNVELENDTMLRKVIVLIVLGFGNGALYFMSSYYGYHSFKSS